MNETFVEEHNIIMGSTLFFEVFKNPNFNFGARVISLYASYNFDSVISTVN